MDRLGLPRDAITYSATISSLAKGKQWHAALQVFDHMQARTALLRGTSFRACTACTGGTACAGGCGDLALEAFTAGASGRLA
jgi:pentatricopeptide repeat protein